MTMRKIEIPKGHFGDRLEFTSLYGLASELIWLRQSLPNVNIAPGTRQGDILAFIRGLRFSAQLIYFLRSNLSSHTKYEVSWGHILDRKRGSCSPECDIIIHKVGHKQLWNGGKDPVMNFKFIQLSQAKVVISCKATTSGQVDNDYPETLKKLKFRNVYLFSESCPKGKFNDVEKKAKRAGYKGYCCLYFQDGPDEASIRHDEKLYNKFLNHIKGCL